MNRTRHDHRISSATIMRHLALFLRVAPPDFKPGSTRRVWIGGSDEHLASKVKAPRICRESTPRIQRMML
jgi:hypothetical protein